MSRFQYVEIKIIIGKDRAADGRNADEPGPDIQPVDRLRNQAMDQAVAAARTVPEGGLL